jgi:hypothetical protein
MANRDSVATPEENAEFQRGMRRLELIQGTDHIAALHDFLQRKQIVTRPADLYDKVTVTDVLGREHTGVRLSIAWRHEFFDQLGLPDCKEDPNNQFLPNQTPNPDFSASIKVIPYEES